MAAGKNLLLVEDEPTLQRILGSVLGDSGHRVDGVATAEQALEHLERGGVDMVLCDKNLPAMSGIDLLAQLRTRWPEIGFVMVTGYPSRESALAVLANDGDGYLVKPFRSLSAAVEHVERLLGSDLPPRRAAAATARRVAQALAGLQVSLPAALPVALLLDDARRAAQARAALTGAGARIVDVDRMPASGQTGLVAGRVEDLSALARRRGGSSLVLLDAGVSFSDVVALIDAGGGAVVDPALLPTGAAA
ncbi:MAG: response regulator [Deltaproteobacteria bacterium]|nr:response regulator [Deltaproteobacteria bacterium]